MSERTIVTTASKTKRSSPLLQAARQEKLTMKVKKRRLSGIEAITDRIAGRNSVFPTCAGSQVKVSCCMFCFAARRSYVRELQHHRLITVLSRPDNLSGVGSWASHISGFEHFA